MAVNPALIKAAVAVATDKRVWVAVGSVVIGLIFMIVSFVGAFLNIFAYDDTGSSIASPAYVEFITNMKDCYRKLDAAADSKSEGLDKDQIHAVFYTLYFGEDKNMGDSFYDTFVECFVSRTTDEEGNESITSCDLDTALERLRMVTGITIPEYSKTQIMELYAILKYQAASAGNGAGDIPDPGGPAPDAYDDSTFGMLMQEATKYIGYPYVWGGSSPSTSFDCSGFVCWSYTKSGVYNLSRTTAQGIYNQCQKISAAEAKPGDLIFFTRTYTSSNPVTHIGIYVGGGKMLHCGDPIKYASIETDYWKSHFYGFGRLSGMSNKAD